MSSPEIAPQPQTASTHTQRAGGGSGAADVSQKAKVPAGIFDVGTKPQALVPSRPIAAPVGTEALVPAGKLQFGEAAGPQLSGGPGAASSAAPSGSLDEAWVNA